MRRSALLAAGAAVLGVVLLIAGQARAHGIGTPRLLNAPAGPYWLSIWTDPDPLRANETHVVVAVLHPQTQEFIVDGVAVNVRLRSLTDPATSLTAAAGTDSVNQLLFTAEFSDRVTPGRWEVGVTATGARGQGDEVTFEVEIASGPGLNWLWIGLGGLGLVLALWIVISTRGGRRSSRRGPD